MTNRLKALTNPVRRVAMLLFAAAFLSACGGGDGESSLSDARSYAQAKKPSTCTPTSCFAVGGTISGLTKGGLVLANGADTVSPAANATSFTFPTLLPKRASYSVTVAAQPTSQECTVANGTGTIDREDVTSVVVTCVNTAPVYAFSFLVTPGGTYSRGHAINNVGQVLGVAAGSDVHATVWSGTTVGQLDPQSWGWGINDAGQVTGSMPGTAVRWTSITPTFLGTLGGTQGDGLDINNAAQVVGWSYVAGNVAQRATLWNDTAAIDLGTLGGANSIAYGINDSGQIVGGSETVVTHGGYNSRAVLWDGTTLTDLGTLGGVWGVAYAINNSGQVVGWSETAGGLARATLWNGTTVVDLGTLAGGDHSGARAINASGQVVGWSYVTGNAGPHATLWSGGIATDLNNFLSASQVSDGWHLVEGYGINDSGWITGIGVNRNTYEQRGFLLSVTPVP